MTRYIDADLVRTEIGKTVMEINQKIDELGINFNATDLENIYEKMIQHILDAPTIDTICGISIDDAVLLLTKYLNGELKEVVRCKSCKLQRGCKNAQYLGLDGYCSYGERSTE